MQWPSAVHAGGFFGLGSGGLHKAPSLECHPGLLLATLEFCPTQRPFYAHFGNTYTKIQRPSCSGKGSRAQSIACSGPGYPDSPQTLWGHPQEWDGTVSTILCWAQTVLQTRHDGLGKPTGVQPGFPHRGIPSLGTPSSGSPCSTGPPSLGNPGLSKEPGLASQSCSCPVVTCHGLSPAWTKLSSVPSLSLGSSSLDSVLWGTLWSPVWRCVSHSVTELCSWTELAGGHELVFCVA